MGRLAALEGEGERGSPSSVGRVGLQHLEWSGEVDYAQSLQSSAQIQSRSNGRSDELILLTHAHWAGGKDSTQCNREVVIPQRNLKLE